MVAPKVVESKEDVGTEPTEKTVQKTLDASKLSKEQIKERLEALENTQKEIQKMLNQHAERLDICSIQR